MHDRMALQPLRAFLRRSKHGCISKELFTFQLYSKATPTSGAPVTMKKTDTLIKPIVPGCVPVFDAYPLPKIPPEIANLAAELNANVEALYKVKGFKVNMCS